MTLVNGKRILFYRDQVLYNTLHIFIKRINKCSNNFVSCYTSWIQRGRKPYERLYHRVCVEYIALANHEFDLLAAHS